MWCLSLKLNKIREAEESSDCAPRQTCFQATCRTVHLKGKIQKAPIFRPSVHPPPLWSHIRDSVKVAGCVCTITYSKPCLSKPGVLEGTDGVCDKCVRHRHAQPSWEQTERTCVLTTESQPAQVTNGCLEASALYSESCHKTIQLKKCRPWMSARLPLEIPTSDLNNPYNFI